MNKKLVSFVFAFNVFMCVFALYECLTSCRRLKKLEKLIED